MSDQRKPKETPCPHITGTVKWGIAANRKWCPICKKFVQLKVDFSGHP